MEAYRSESEEDGVEYSIGFGVVVVSAALVSFSCAVPSVELPLVESVLSSAAGGGGGGIKILSEDEVMLSLLSSESAFLLSFSSCFSVVFTAVFDNSFISALTSFVSSSLGGGGGTMILAELSALSLPLFSVQ